MTPDPIRIAIVGGGLGGASLANALVRHAHLKVEVFESAPEFSERGAAVGLSCNAQAALQQFIPSASELFSKAGAVPMRSSRVMMGCGPDAGAFVCDIEGGPHHVARPGLVVHRASLLRELIAPLPPEALHANMKVVSIDNRHDIVEVTFQDGTVSRFDAVVGADGIFSSVRKHVVERDEWMATPSGFWDSRNLILFERAKTTLGEEYFKLDRQYGWVGDGAYFLHDVLENQTVVQCVMSGVEKDPPRDRKRDLSRPFLVNMLSTWLEGPIARSMIDLLLDQPNPEGYSAWEHRSTSSYAKGRLCIVGDAAHAMTPWQGAGAGQAIEDAMILGTLLGSVSSTAQIESAFKAFDAVRRPRCQRIIDSSRGTGQIMCGQDSQVGLDVRKIKDALASRWEFIFGLDMAEHKEDALERMRQSQG